MAPFVARASTRRGLAPLLFLGVLGAVDCGRPRSDDADHDPSAVASASPPPPGAGPVSTTPGPTGTEEWNPSQIDWQPFATASTRAKAENKPVCVVFSATWCPHCKNYSRVFNDPRIAARAKDFEMVRVDVDAEPALSAKFSPDGGYVPRTYFIGPDGTLSAEIHAPRPRYQYFYDERDPGSLLAGMEASLRKLGR